MVKRNDTFSMRRLLRLTIQCTVVFVLLIGPFVFVNWIVDGMDIHQKKAWFAHKNLFIASQILYSYALEKGMFPEPKGNILPGEELEKWQREIFAEYGIEENRLPNDPYSKRPRQWLFSNKIGRDSEFDVRFKGGPIEYHLFSPKRVAIRSDGPDHVRDWDFNSLDDEATYAESIEALQVIMYDPTNGTISSGDMIRLLSIE